MDRWIIRFIANRSDKVFQYNLGISLINNPAVHWYFINKCPECKDQVDQLIQNTPYHLTAQEIRNAEIFVLNETDSFLVYIYPELMEQLSYIKLWDEERLLSMADFRGKIVLDIGSGTGRLAFAAVSQAKWVYASEPVDRLREFMREKAQRLQVKNITIVDGTVETIPYPEDTFDIVMTGYVLGDDYQREYEEMKRVVKSGGYIIECMGEDDRKPDKPKVELVELGFDYSCYLSKVGGNVFRYRKQIVK
jgi:SAM-dependent methyltransferase